MQKRKREPEAEPVVMAWEPEPLRERLKKCRAMLHLHDVMTDAESDRVMCRIYRMEEKRGKTN